MHFTAVESTTLASVAYDEARQLLQLEFRSRDVYLYFGVPATVHEILLGAPSKGACFNQAVRGRYPYVRVSRLPGSADGADQHEERGATAWHAL